VGVSILSYAGAVQFALITDKKICKDPQAIIDRFRPEFENLVHAVLLMPWDEEADPELASRALAATEALADAADHLLPHGVHDAASGAAQAPSQAPATVLDGATPVVEPLATDAELQMPPAADTRPAGLRKRKSAFSAARATRH